MSNGENRGDSWVVTNDDQPIIWMYRVGKWMEQQVNQSVPMINCGWQITVANWIWNHFYLCDFWITFVQKFRSEVVTWLLMGYQGNSLFECLGDRYEFQSIVAPKQ